MNQHNKTQKALWTFLSLFLLIAIVITSIFALERFKPDKTSSLIIPKGKLEQFPTITNNTYQKEVYHQELVTKKDILNFKLDKINNKTAFEQELDSIGNNHQQYQLEFTEHKIVFENSQKEEETLLNKIEVTKFEVFISHPPTNESLNNTPEGWNLVKKEKDTYLKITYYNHHIWFLDFKGKQIKKMSHPKEEWANTRNQLAKERGENLRNWADFNYPVDKLLIFSKFYYWWRKKDDYTYIVPIYWEINKNPEQNNPIIEKNFLYNSQLFSFNQNNIPMVSSHWDNFHIIWGFPFYFRYLVANVNWDDKSFRDYWLGIPIIITNSFHKKYEIYVDKVIPQYIFELIQFEITLGAVSTLKNSFVRIIEAQEALMASRNEEEVWLFKGKIQALFEDLGFNQFDHQGFQDVIREKPEN